MTTRVLFLLLFTFSMANAAEKKLKVDASHTEIGFQIKHLMIANVKGKFNKFDSSIVFNEKTKKVSAITLTIEAASIDTNEADRDKHLRGSDFFETEKFPQITFTSNGATLKKDEVTLVRGKLKIRNISKDINLKITYLGMAKDPWGNVHYVFEAEGKLKRSDFGLNWNKTLDQGGVVISDDVKLVIEAQYM